ncbi:MAG: hypothetical protein A3G21_07400 [Acidobacteria bacterium RIFCSPLOWO2_12_FULL_66_21]|nr:MAG: hypothetical protein A3G21_07400 [Acidobacteria bacterium RIFCSPLOWO2_12_FULL_66_21]
MKNEFFYGDNLDVLRRYVADESVDLVYLDPPFNSRQNYNVLFKGGSERLSRTIPIVLATVCILALFVGAACSGPGGPCQRF